MNNLTTQKIVLGLLMTLVLVFGVQGIAKAVENPNTDDVTTETTVASTVFNVGASSSISSITTTFDKIGTKETVSISRTGGITLTGDFYGLSSVTLTENEDTTDDTDANGNGFTYTRDGRTQTLSSEATGAIGITFTAKGIQSVTIRSRDYDGTSGGAAGSWSKTYTYYVKGPGTSTTTTSLLGLRNGYKTGIFAGTTHRERIHTGDGGHYAVTYTTIPDTAQAQIEDTTGALGALADLNDAETSSAFDVLLQVNATYQVTAKVDDSDRETIGVYIIGTPTLTVGHPGDPNGDDTLTDAVAGSKGSPGRIDDTLPAEVSPTNRAFTAMVTDGANAAVPGVVVTFRAGGSGTGGGRLVFNSPTNAGILVDSSNRSRLDSNGNQLLAATDRILYVRTNASGQADVDFQLGTDRKQDVTIGAVGQSKVVSAYAGDAVSGNQLVNPRSKNSQASGRSGEYELRVEVEDEDGEAVPNEYIEFRTNDGILEHPGTGETTNLGRLGVRTDTQGIAFVFFDPKDGSGAPRVTAHLLDLGTPDALGGTGDAADKVIDDVVFDIGGTVTRDDQLPPTPANSLVISPTSITGDADDTETITVTAIANGITVPGVSVALSLPSNFTAEGGSASATSGSTSFTSTLTLPDEAGTYIISADAPGYASTSVVVTVESDALGTLTISPSGTAVNGVQDFRVTARDADGSVPTGSLSVEFSGTGFTPTAGVVVGGSSLIPIRLPTTAATYTLQVSATGYNPATTRVTVSGAGQPLPTTQGSAAGVADSLEIDGNRQLSATVGQNLQLRVRVLDANDNGVSDVGVTFRVLAPGRGTFAGARGTGRAIRGNTDRSGYATTVFTPTSDGNVIVQVTAAGVSDPVTFIIAVGEADDTPTPTSRVIDPDVHVGAANRPPMLWVDNGKIYALVGADVQEFASGVEGALNIAIGGNKVYWTEQTGESSGTINSADLDGSDVEELKAIKAVPMGIAVDTGARKLYWTNSRGRIQSADLDASGIENVIVDLPGPRDLALSRGILYWTQYDATEGEGNVGIVNPTVGRKVARYISTGSDMPGSIAIDGNKVYWTEMTGSNSGTINSANLNGTNPTELNDIRAVPMGIGVDSSRSKLYWTNSRGRVQSANLDGRKIQSVVEGLGNPGDMVLSNSISAPTTTPTTPTTASKSKYDVNGNGAVDNMDVAEVVTKLGGTDHRYDFNGDGVVDVVDLVLISKEVDEGAAGAPTILGMQLSAAQIDVLKEQIDLLIATGDRSRAAMRTLIYLQQLIATARPEKTQLLANYPNPFNPETWIPYELATDTTVKITIYNTQGVVVRTLELGHQAAGYYTGRDRAAYWDGRNAFGEQVASGIYFYQFETDGMSSMRKMVILK